jgi:hypothetical protein
LGPSVKREIAVPRAGLSAVNGERIGPGIAVEVFERDYSPSDRLQGDRLGVNETGRRALKECLPKALFDKLVASCANPSRAITFLDHPLNRLLSVTAGRAKALALKEFYRKLRLKVGESIVFVPAIQAIFRSQVALAAKGNGPRRHRNAARDWTGIFADTGHRLSRFERPLARIMPVLPRVSPTRQGDWPFSVAWPQP